MKKIFTLMAVAAIALAAQAAQLTVADGTDTNQYIPFRAAYFNYPPYFGQVIYPAGQLTQLEGKNITGLTFYIANEGGSVMNGGELSFSWVWSMCRSIPSSRPSASLRATSR